MTSAYLPTWPNDVYLIEIGIPGPPGTGFTPAEAVQVRTDLNMLLSRPNISTVESLTNVPDSGAVSGQTIVKGAGDDWVYGNPNSSLAIVYDNWSGTPNVTNATILSSGAGIKVEELPHGSGKRAHMLLQFGGTGTATTVSRSDHQHMPVVILKQFLPYQGVLSTGYREMYSGGVFGLNASITYDITVTVMFDVIAAGLDSIVTPRIGMGGGTLEGYDVQFKGHGKNITVMNHASGVTGLTTYPVLVRVFYQSGPQIEIGAGQILAVARPRS